MACNCPICLSKGTNGHGVTREKRLRGWEFEISLAAISAFTDADCKGHLTFCEKDKKCPLEAMQEKEGPCDCLACQIELGVKEKKFQCPGHGCFTPKKKKRQQSRAYEAFEPADLEARDLGTPGAALDWLNDTVIKAVDGQFAVKGEFRGHRTTPRDNDYWDLKTDGSCGYEIATPPVEGEDVEIAILPVVKAIQMEEQRHGGKRVMDNKCGLHCTFDVRDVGVRGAKKILLMALRHQAALIGTQPAYRKNNQYCKFIQRHPKLKKVLAGVRRPETMAMEPATKDRYNFINLSKVYNGLGLIEFRFGGATTEPKQVEAYGVLLECLIEAALRRPKVSAASDRKKKLYQEVIEPFLGDERVKRAWKETLGPALEAAELARA